jgi:short-subunit dehydrogenase
VEHLANALRLELTDLGVTVGCAHMSWIDTALVRDSKADMPSFQEMLTKLPGPLSKTTSLDKCAAAFVKGIERRKRRIYCPGWIRLFRWLKPVLSTLPGEAVVRRSTAELLPRMDAEVAALGRSTSASNEALQKR